MAVIVGVAVIVIAPVTVAALGNGNATVGVIDAVSDHATGGREWSTTIPQNIAEGCGRTTRADKAKHYTIARGSAMESAAHLDVMRVDELIDSEHYVRGTELLERIVAMLTKLIDP